MVPTSETPQTKTLELDARALWQRERLPPPSGVLGPADGPVVHELEGAFAATEAGMLVVQRAVAADVDARALALSGRRAAGMLRLEDDGPPAPDPPLVPVLAALGVWVGGDGDRRFVARPAAGAIQRITERLAHAGVLAVRDVALRVCPACAVPRDPERIVYREENGDTLLVRFPLEGGDRPISALVWTDSAWRLLGASALLVHPDLPYVVARYRREGAEELVLTSRSSLDRIRRWLRGAELEVVEEHPGKHWAGTAYVHPLRHEFPIGGGLEPPAGTILTIPEVTDTGTGVVPLIPGHGGNDAVIAERLGVPGWPLVTTKGRFDIMLVHKYAGLELDSGDDFVGRDLSEGGAIFARLRVRRGVPHCARCGSGLIWAPGRAWCLEPSRLPPAALTLYRAVLPRERPIERLEAVPWPVSEPLRSDDPSAVSLLECTSCDRLEAPGAGSDRCTCGGRRRPVRRRLLPGFDSAAAAWGGLDPFPPADAVRLFVNARRRAPAVVHHLAAMSGVAGVVGDVRVTVLPTVPEVDLPGLLSEYGADAVRAALVRAQDSPGRTETFPERCAQERARLDRLLASARAYATRVDPTALASFGQPIGGFVGELEPEDRAVLARFERMRVQALADLDRGATPSALRRLFRFIDNEFSVYRGWAGPRLAMAGSPPTKRAALRTLVHLFRESSRLLAPVAPHTAETVHGLLAPRRASVFQQTMPGVDRALLDDDRAQAWERWDSVLRALHRDRRSWEGPTGAAPPLLVLVLPTDAEADAYRAEAPILARLAGVGRIEVGSPASPWTGRRRQLRPVEAEIQRVYSSRAAQIIHLLRRTSERKVADPGPQGFSLMVNGQPTQILPSMLDWVETLPERVVPVPWGSGEMYVERAAGPHDARAPPPPMSPDAFRLIARVRHRLRESPAADPKSVVLLVAAPAAVGAELAAVAAPAAAYLGIGDVRVVASEAELPAGPREIGREHGGARWAFHLSGLPAVVSPRKPRRIHARGDRVRPAFSPSSILPSVPNYAGDEWVTRHNAVRTLGEELDQLLGRPLLGPAKIDAAWDAGLRSVDDFRRADWAALVALPGFGSPIAAALVEKLGGTVPEPPPRPVRPRKRAAGGNGGIDSESSRVPESAAPPAPPTPSVPLPRDAPLSDSRTHGRGARPPPLPSETAPVPPSAPPGAPASIVPSEGAAPEAGSSAPEPSGVVGPSPPPPPPEIPPAPGSAPPPLPPETAPSAAEPPTSPRPEPMAGPAPDSDTAVTGTSPSDVPVAPAPSGSPLVPEPEESPRSDEELVPSDSPVFERQEALPPAPSPPSLPPADATPELPPPVELPALPDAPLPALPDETPAETPESTGNPPSEPVPPPTDAAPAGDESRGGTLPPTEPPPGGAPPPESAAPLEPTVQPRPPGPEVSLDRALPVPSPFAAPLPPVAALEPSPAPADPSTPTPLLPEPEPAPPPSGGIELDVGTSYLPSLERFLDATAAGHSGVCIVRDSPERVRAYAGSRPVEIRWLTNIGRGATLKPTDLEGLSGFLAHALSHGRATAFFLEGFEYLVRLHGLDRVIAELIAFDQLARAQSARVWLHLNPKLLSPDELARFVSALGGSRVVGTT